MKGTKKSQKQKSKKDPLKKFKYIGYCRGVGKPGDQITFDDLVNFAKAYLCRQTKTLWNDPIWDQYHEAEILTEYFSHIFATNEEMRKQFETELNVEAYGEDLVSWFDKQIEENKKELEVLNDKMEDKVSFSPDELGS